MVNTYSSAISTINYGGTKLKIYYSQQNIRTKFEIKEIMHLQTEKIELAKTILNTDNPAFIKQIKAIFSTYDTDLWDELSDYQKSVVNLAKAELKAGKGKPHSAVMKKYKKWLTK